MRSRISIPPDVPSRRLEIAAKWKAPAKRYRVGSGANTKGKRLCREGKCAGYLTQNDRNGERNPLFGPLHSPPSFSPTLSFSFRPPLSLSLFRPPVCDTRSFSGRGVRSTSATHKKRASSPRDNLGERKISSDHCRAGRHRALYSVAQLSQYTRRDMLARPLCSEKIQPGNGRK